MKQAEFEKLLTGPNKLSKEEEIAVFKFYNENKTLHNKQLIAEKTKDLINISLPHYSQFTDRDDLYQEGFLGLWHAIDKFDYSLGNRFSTFADIWIAKKMQRFLIYDGNIKKSEESVWLKRKIEREHSNSSNEEITSALNISEKDLYTIRCNFDTLSFDKKLTTEDDDSTLSEFIKDEAQDVSKYAERLDLAEKLPKYLKTILTDEEYNLVKYAFGLEGEEILGEKRLAKKLGVRKEAIRLKLSKILNKIRKNEATKDFKIFHT